VPCLGSTGVSSPAKEDFLVFEFELSQTKEIVLSLGLVLGVAVVLLKFFKEKTQKHPAYFLVLLYDLLKVTAVGLALVVTINIYQLSLKNLNANQDADAIAKILAAAEQEIVVLRSVSEQQEAKISELLQLNIAYNDGSQIKLLKSAVSLLCESENVPSWSNLSALIPKSEAIGRIDPNELAKALLVSEETRLKVCGRW